MSAAAIDFRHPRARMRPGRAPPRVITVTIERYRRDFEARRGPLWDWAARHVPAVYEPDAPARVRALRTDGADTLLCAIVTLLSCMDLTRGFLARPPAPGEQRWHRRSVRELFGFAFGAPVPGRLSPRRLERALRALGAIGAIASHQVRLKGPAGYQSQPALRFVTDKLFRLAGTAGLLAQERREAYQRAAAARSGASAARRIETIRLDPAQPGSSMLNPTRADPPAGRARAGPRPAADLLGSILPPRRSR